MTNFNNKCFSFSFLCFLIANSILGQSEPRATRSIEFFDKSDSIIFYHNDLKNLLEVTIYCNFLKSEKISSGLYKGMYFDHFESGVIINSRSRIKLKTNEFFINLDSNSLYTQDIDYANGSLKVNKYSIDSNSIVLQKKFYFDGDTEIFFENDEKVIVTTNLIEGYGNKLSLFSQKFDSLAVINFEQGFKNVKAAFNDESIFVVVESGSGKNKLLGYSRQSLNKFLEKDIDSIADFVYQIGLTKSGILISTSLGKLSLIDKIGELIWTKSNINSLASFYTPDHKLNYSFDEDRIFYMTFENKVCLINEKTGTVQKEIDLSTLFLSDSPRVLKFIESNNRLFLLTNRVKNHQIEGSRLYHINIVGLPIIEKSDVGIVGNIFESQNGIGVILKDKINIYEK